MKEEAETDKLIVEGARVHNLKNVTVEIPRHKLVVITGLSGSGKSSLAFDTIYAEGQRRYIETFSAYARNFLGNLERPDVDNISGLSPVISIEQKTVNKNPRSTVGTITEVYDYLRLLYARAGEAYSYVSGEKMVRYTEQQILELILKDYENVPVYILAPLVRNRKGHYRELFENIAKKGYLTVRVDGELREIVRNMKLDRYSNHAIEVVIDKLRIQQKDAKRIQSSLQTAMKMGNGMIILMRHSDNQCRYFSRLLMCPISGISYPDPSPHNFSFNSPHGACPTCDGMGIVSHLDIDKIIPDRTLSIAEGALMPYGKLSDKMLREFSEMMRFFHADVNTPVKDLPPQIIDLLLHGTVYRTSVDADRIVTERKYPGLIHYIEEHREGNSDYSNERWREQFYSNTVCHECHGNRLNKEALHYKIGDKNIAELSKMDLDSLNEWLCNVEQFMSGRQLKIATEILKEIRSRIHFLLDVGLNYLTLDRPSVTLSGGESQRIRLATQIGARLVNVMYILDEPSIGLHQRDNMRLINSLKALRDEGNSVIVVEHDKEMMLEADHIVDLGPKAGRLGGEIVFSGSPKEMIASNTLTTSYLNGTQNIVIPPTRRAGNGNGKHLTLHGAKGNNLKNLTVSFPLGKLICVTGVSGSGKSTLINSTLQPILSKHFYRSLQNPLPYDSIDGLEYIDKVVNVDQAPIGRTPRSNPATYTGVFTDIRKLFAELPESKIRGYKLGRFSFNVSGGRCEKCGGNGYNIIEMNFLPDVMVPCEECRGKRYNRETLAVQYRNKSIADVLDMTINQAVEFFNSIPEILHKIKTIQEVGLGYIKLGQSSTTLSGGESQRIKLASELSKKDTGKTVYILDEPTTGLHFEDIRILLQVLNRLVDKGNTVIVIEHNMDVIKSADYLIDIGPEGGKNGGEIVCCGTPEEILSCEKSHTARYLKQEMK